MNKARICIILSIISVLTIGFVLLPAKNVYASNVSDFFNIVFQEGKEFTEEGEQGQGILNVEGLYDVFSFLYNGFFAIGIVVALFVGLALGFRIITGSLDERADAKRELIPYLILVGILVGVGTSFKIILYLISLLEA